MALLLAILGVLLTSGLMLTTAAATRVQLEGDYGDAPASYANAFHAIIGQEWLGCTDTPSVTGETAPKRVDLDELDDGVSADGTVCVTIAENALEGERFLNIWIDLNDNGSWDSPAEYAMSNFTIQQMPGTNMAYSFPEIRDNFGSHWLRVSLTRHPLTEISRDGTVNADFGETEDYGTEAGFDSLTPTPTYTPTPTSTPRVPEDPVPPTPENPEDLRCEDFIFFTRQDLEQAQEEGATAFEIAFGIALSANNSTAVQRSYDAMIEVMQNNLQNQGNQPLSDALIDEMLEAARIAWETPEDTAPPPEEGAPPEDTSPEDEQAALCEGFVSRLDGILRTFAANNGQVGRLRSAIEMILATPASDTPVNTLNGLLDNLAGLPDDTPIDNALIDQLLDTARVKWPEDVFNTLNPPPPPQDIQGGGTHSIFLAAGIDDCHNPNTRETVPCEQGLQRDLIGVTYVWTETGMQVIVEIQGTPLTETPDWASLINFDLDGNPSTGDQGLGNGHNMGVDANVFIFNSSEGNDDIRVFEIRDENGNVTDTFDITENVEIDENTFTVDIPPEIIADLSTLNIRTGPGSTPCQPISSTPSPGSNLPACENTTNTVVELIGVGDNAAWDHAPGFDDNFAVDSFFDVFTEISIDGGETFTPPDETRNTCSVTVNGNSNLRAGPGTDRAVAGSARGGQTVIADGRILAEDGFVWFHLDTGAWIRSDLVTEGGGCDNLFDLALCQPAEAILDTEAFATCP